MVGRIAVALFAFSVLVAAQTVPPTSKPQPAKFQPKPALMKAVGNYGGWWNALSDDEKDNFIDGYMTAMGRVKFVADGLSDDARKSMKAGVPQAEFMERVKGVMALELLSGLSNFTVDRPLVPDPETKLLVSDVTRAFRERLDDFYKDQRNQFILVSLAFEYIRDGMTGKKTPGQLLDELNEWQKITRRDSH